MNLDRTKPYGKIAGENFIPDGCDRPAMYEQDSKLFDAHGRLIEPGVAGARDEADDAAATGDTLSVADLLRQADSLPLRTFKQQAKAALGPSCPASKIAIIEQLTQAQQEFNVRAERRKSPPAAVAAPVVPEPAPPTATGVDLKAWARGDREYLFGEVRKAIKKAYGRNVIERDDAVEFLISQGVVTAGEARQDVIRAA